MQKPHICFVSESEATYGLLTGGDSSVVGGAEVQQTLFGPALQKLGYTVTFLVPDLGQPAKVITQQGMTLIKTRRLFKKSPGLRQYLEDMYLLFRAMNRAGADIYYQRTSATITGIVALFCKLKRKPFVFSVAHNMDLDGTWKQYMKRRYHRFYWYGLTRATSVVVQTNDQVRLLKEHVGREGVLIRSTFATPDDSNEGPTKDCILWVGSFRKVRRPEMLFDVAARLPQYRFVMVGGPAVGEEAIFDRASAKAGQIPNIEMTGPVPYKEVGRYFGEANLLVNTSSAEGFPNTYLQAWCRGVPVVATFDADSLISKHGLGRHCKDLHELAAAVKELVMDEALRTSIGEQAVRYVKEHHSVEGIAAQYDKLFMQLYRGRTRSTPGGRKEGH